MRELEWWCKELEAPESISFNVWMHELDKVFIADLGCPHNDFEDYNWRDEFDSEVSPQDAYDEWKLHTEGGTRSPSNF